MSDDPFEAAARWWRTSICDIAPGRIAFRGYPVEALIGNVTFPAMIWLMLRGDLPSQAQERLLQAALVASVDHGPHAPSIAIAQMAVSCGLPLNGAMASAVNTLDDVHGGAGEQAVQLYEQVLEGIDAGKSDASAAQAAIAAFVAHRGKYLPGFGHRFHPVDPRAGRLLALVDEAVAAGAVTGRHARAARAVEASLLASKGKRIPMNIDGATAVIYGELGFEAPLARGVFCLSRSVGILAHAWEQTGRKARNKGPMPKIFGYAYEGPARRQLDESHTTPDT
jgi:citrate synthase